MTAPAMNTALVRPGNVVPDARASMFQKLGQFRCLREDVEPFVYLRVPAASHRPCSPTSHEERDLLYRKRFALERI